MPRRFEPAASTIAPGAVIGILGGGQLGRMLAMAAARLGFHAHIFCPEAAAPACEVAGASTIAAFDDDAALDRFAAAVDLVTLEFENVPVGALDRLARTRPVRPGSAVLATTQDRLAEKRAIEAAGFATTRYVQVDSPADLEAAFNELGGPAILKTRRQGYDGRGQARIRSAADLAAAWPAIGGVAAILEREVPFDLEISVLAARGADGALATFGPMHNRHENGVLRTTTVPAPLDPECATAALATARSLAERLDVIGLLAVEMFVVDGGRLLINELAPRVHNSGHWTLDACATDQFEQQIRAITGLPLGATGPLCPAQMTNLLGAEIEHWPDLLRDPAAKVHVYGKAEVRPGRKMGHVTRLRGAD